MLPSWSAMPPRGGTAGLFQDGLQIGQQVNKRSTYARPGAHMQQCAAVLRLSVVLLHHTIMYTWF